MAAAIEGLACLRTATDPDIAAQLLGAARAIRTDTATRLTLIEGPDPVTARALVESALGAAKAADAIMKGARTPADRVFQLADSG